VAISDGSGLPVMVLGVPNVAAAHRPAWPGRRESPPDRSRRAIQLTTARRVLGGAGSLVAESDAIPWAGGSDSFTDASPFRPWRNGVRG
jgi:hypothetical protein